MLVLADSDVAQSLLTRAAAARRAGDISGAAQLYEQVLAEQPGQPDALHFLGVLAFQNGDTESGLRQVEAAVQARPQAAEFLGNLGSIYLAQKRLPEALRTYQRALQLAPQDAGIACNLGVALIQSGAHAEAVGLMRQLIARQPGNAAAHGILGNAARQAGDKALAQQSFMRQVQLAPRDPEAHYNLGVILQDQWEMAGARRAYEQALALKDDVARYHVNLGAALMKLHEVAAAGRSYKRALELDPSLAEAHYNYAICLLLQGDIPAGAREYEWRLKVDETSLSKPREMSVPRWDGKPDPAKTVLLHSEQGLGDMIQFIRFAPAVAAMVGKVVVEVPRPLVRIFQDSFPQLTILAKGTELPAVDAHCPLMSLLNVLGVTLDDLPATAMPYLKAQPERIAKWRARLEGKPGRRIAISWQGNPKAKVDRGRSLPLAQLIPLLQLPGLRFISLQKNDGAEQLAALPPELRARIETLGDDYDAGPDGFVDTLAVMECVDTIVTTDTALAHVAGALGRPTLLMLKKTPDWRWLLERADTPWYPTTRLIRQRREDDWPQVIADVGAILQPMNNQLGRALQAHQAGQLDTAEGLYRQVLQQEPQSVVARHHLGVIALQRGQHDLAETQIRAALAIKPDDADALANLALALKNQGRLEEAEQTCRQVLALAPQHAGTHNNLGNLLKTRGEFVQAIAHYRAALAAQPASSNFLHNLGLAQLEAHQLAEGELSLRQAVRQSPANPDLHFDLARALFMQGKWRAAWPEYEWRRQMREFGVASGPDLPLWQGEVNPALHVLVHAEQGLGDAIQFVRFCAAARGRIGRLSLVVPPHLKALLSRAAGVDAIYGYGEVLPPAQAQCPLLSLPAVLQVDTADLAGQQPYLQPEPQALARWQAWRKTLSGRVIGLSWQGNPKARADVGRSLQLTQLLPLADVSGITFVALQKGAALEQVAAMPATFPLVVPPEPFDAGPQAFEDTAALMQVCDLIITTDTATAHLAGALARPTIVLLKHTPDWRWQISGAHCPWYPSAQLLRQPRPGEWASVIAELKVLLQNPVAPSSGLPTLVQCLQDHRAGKLVQARTGYAALLAVAPQDITARHYHGVVLHQLGDHTAGEREIRAALTLKPDYAEAWGNLGLTLKAQGKTQEAAEVYERSLMLDPNNADVHNNYGNLLCGLGKPAEGLAQYDAAIALQPGKAEGHHNRGNALGDLERYEEAIASFKRALAIRPHYVSALNGLGKAYRESGQVDAAIAVFREAVAAEPLNADTHSNLGVCYREQGRYPEALSCYDEAIRLRPDHAESYGNRAIALHYTARFEEAEAAYSKAIELKPERADPQFGLAAVWLTQGKWAQGWPQYEWRRKMKDSGPERKLSGQPWQGALTRDQTVFLYAEQGLGDTLQFLRFIPLVAAQCQQVIFEVQPGLHRLVSAALPQVRVIRQGEALPLFDVHCPLMSVPGLLGITLESLPAPPRYLQAEPERVAQWAQQLPPRQKLRVAINWQGNPKAAVDKCRSIPLVKLQPLLELADISFISLQKNAGIEQLDNLPMELRARVHTLGADFDGGKDAFVDTAAVMEACDLIITTDTAMAHLAGALGRPCWTLLKFMPDWRWLFGRDDCPWYPTTRLFRQPREQDWEAVVRAVKQAITELKP